MDDPQVQTNTTTSGGPAAVAPDGQAVARAHDDTFAAFYREAVPKLVLFLRWQGVPLTDAADIAQETMILAYRDWPKLEHPAAWTRRVASRTWARRLAHNLEDPTLDDQAEGPTLLTVTDTEAWEQRHDVLRVLDQLPPRQRQVLAWTLDGYAPAEIASQLNMSPEAVRSSLKKARRTVAAYLRTQEEPHEHA